MRQHSLMAAQLPRGILSASVKEFGSQSVKVIQLFSNIKIIRKPQQTAAFSGIGNESSGLFSIFSINVC